MAEVAEGQGPIIITSQASSWCLQHVNNQPSNM